MNDDFLFHTLRYLLACLLASDVLLALYLLHC